MVGQSGVVATQVSLLLASLVKLWTSDSRTKADIAEIVAIGLEEFSKRPEARECTLYQDSCWVLAVGALCVSLFVCASAYLYVIHSVPIAAPTPAAVVKEKFVNHDVVEVDSGVYVPRRRK